MITRICGVSGFSVTFMALKGMGWDVTGVVVFIEQISTYTNTLTATCSSLNKSTIPSATEKEEQRAIDGTRRAGGCGGPRYRCPQT